MSISIQSTKLKPNLPPTGHVRTYLTQQNTNLPNSSQVWPASAAPVTGSQYRPHMLQYPFGPSATSQLPAQPTTPLSDFSAAETAVNTGHVTAARGATAMRDATATLACPSPWDDEVVYQDSDDEAAYASPGNFETQVSGETILFSWHGSCALYACLEGVW